VPIIHTVFLGLAALALIVASLRTDQMAQDSARAQDCWQADAPDRARRHTPAELQQLAGDPRGSPSLGSPVRNAEQALAADHRWADDPDFVAAAPLETHELLTPAQKRCGVTITPRRGCGRTRVTAAKKARSAGRGE
jgi:hypothetical protein